MSKVPTPAHPVDRLTTTELSAYIEDLKEALHKDLSDEEHDLILRRLGEAYRQQNNRAADGAMAPAKPVPEVPASYMTNG